jgi:hypothetical protein
MNWWDAIVTYYKTIGEKYQVDPVIFVGIHVIATPLFAAAVWWIIYNKKKKRSLVAPAVVAAFIFQAANIYLILYGKDIPWWIYAIVGTTAILSSYVTFKKVKTKLAAIQ